MAKKRTVKGKKRGPKEERLVIQEDPQDALKRLLKPDMPPKRRKWAPSLHGLLRLSVIPCIDTPEAQL